MTKKSCISAFDLDKTLIKENIAFRFGVHLCQKRYLSYSALAFIYQTVFYHNLGFFDVEQVHRRAFQRLFLNRPFGEMKELADRFIEQNIERFLYHPAVERLQHAQREGHHIVILSSSIDFLVAPIARLLSVEHWHASSYNVDNFGKLSEIDSLLLGKNKGELLKQIRQQKCAAKEDTYAYTDSHLDIAFLAEAGNPVGVNPDRRLRVKCKEMCWPII